MQKLVSLVATVLVVLLAGAPLLAEVEKSEYADWIGRPIKALSPEEIADYLDGRGMGFALAAELNRYPGPKHVIELAPELDLSAEQAEATASIFDAMAREARELGRQLVEREAELDRSFAEGKIDEASLALMIDEIAALRGGIRRAHLGAHLKMAQVLSPSQIERYVELRGYSDGSSGHTGHGDHRSHGGHDGD